MLSICCYCHRFLGVKGDPADKRISHGACSRCAEAHLDQYYKEMGIERIKKEDSNVQSR